MYQRETVDDRADHKPTWEGMPPPGRTVEDAVEDTPRDGGAKNPPPSGRTVDDDAEHRPGWQGSPPPGRTVGPSSDS